MTVSLTSIHCIADTASAWHLLHCKPRQDERAEQNLLCQGYACYRPQHRCERIVCGCRQIIAESLFPGLFIQLATDASWALLRLDNSLIAHLQQRTAPSVKSALEVGDSVRIGEGSFAAMDAIFMVMDGE